MTNSTHDLFQSKPVRECLQEIKKQSVPEMEYLIRLSCLMEATATKPGNVHPDASFDNCSYDDFVQSALLVSPILAKANTISIGRTIYNSVEVIHKNIGSNTNLGIILLLAPFCAIPEKFSLNEGILQILNGLTVEDSVFVYEAIQLSNAGGIGKVDEQDISEKPTLPLLELMKLSKKHDRIASEYCTGFSIILNEGIELLGQSVQLYKNWNTAIIHLHLWLMSHYPDTLISRKCGNEIAEQSAIYAKETIDAGWPDSDSGKQKLTELDRWLRADGHSRNPGTTADFVAAIIFAGFRDNLIPIPTEYLS